MEDNVSKIDKQQLIGRDKRNEASLQKCLRISPSRGLAQNHTTCVACTWRFVRSEWRSHYTIRRPTARTHQSPSKDGTTAEVILVPLAKTTMASAAWREFAKMIILYAGVLRDIGSIFVHFEFTDNAGLLINKWYLI